MQVREIMTPNVECVSPDCSIQEAAGKMRDLDVGVLPICDNDRLAGMITDRDIVVRAAAQGRNPTSTQVREAMTSEAVWCFEDQDISEAAKLMKDKQIRRLLVLNRNKRLVGIVSLGDLAVETHDDQMVGNTLEAISEPAMPTR